MSTTDASTTSVGDVPNAAGALDPSTLIGAISGGAADPISLIVSQLGAQADDSPVVAVLSRLLEQRRSLPAGSEDDKDADVAATRAELERKERERGMQDLRDTVEKAYAELESLRARNDALAAALGACFLCFGNDPLCQECGGRGVPGSRPPEPAAYRRFVLPAMRRVRMIQAGTARNPPSLAGASPGEMRSWHSVEKARPVPDQRQPKEVE